MRWKTTAEPKNVTTAEYQILGGKKLSRQKSTAEGENCHQGRKKTIEGENPHQGRKHPDQAENHHLG